MMQPTLLANTWMAAHLPSEKYMAVLCCAGSAGESAFRNSLDESFAEAGYQHQPATLHHRRPPTYYVTGTSRGSQPIRRIAHTSKSLRFTTEFRDALIQSNATTMTLSLDAVTINMTHMTSLNMSDCTGLKSIVLPPNVEELGVAFFLAAAPALQRLI